MIKVLYFASYREMLDCDEEAIEYSEQVGTPQMLATQLEQRGAPWKSIFSGEQRISVAINQAMAHMNTTIKDGDEIAFFPPVTGG